MYQLPNTLIEVQSLKQHVQSKDIESILIS